MRPAARAGRRCSRSGPLGGAGLLYTKTAIVVGQLALALPMVVALFAASTEALPANLERTARTLGAGRLRTFLTVLAEARLGLVVAVLAAFGRVVSELGIAMMLGGNIKHHTRTMTTAIALETQKGAFGASIALGLVLLGLSLVVNAIVGAVSLPRTGTHFGKCSSETVRTLRFKFFVTRTGSSVGGLGSVGFVPVSSVCSPTGPAAAGGGVRAGRLCAGA